MADHREENAAPDIPAAARTDEKRYTQKELDAAVEKRLAEERRKAPGRLAKANRRHLAAEAKLAAVTLGVPPKRAAYAAKLADLAAVPVDEETGPDTAAVKKAVQTVLADIPELKLSAQDEKAPGLRIGANSTPSHRESAAPAASRVKPWNKFRG